MGNRITRGDLEQTLRIINERLRDRGSDVRLCLEYSYGRPRVAECTPENPHPRRFLSVRDRTGVIHAWLWAFLTGLDMGIRIYTDE